MGQGIFQSSWTYEDEGHVVGSEYRLGMLPLSNVEQCR